jgi:transcriptional activator HAC1
MLWYDLQCQSRAAATSTSPASTTSTSQPSQWATLFFYLMTLQLQTCYKAILLAVWSLSPSRMARLMQASAHRSTSRLTTSSTTTAPLLLQSMAMARSRAATGRPAQRVAALLAALQRSSGNEVLMTRARAAAARQRLLTYQRQALGEKGHDADDGQGNQKGGV